MQQQMNCMFCGLYRVHVLLHQGLHPARIPVAGRQPDRMLPSACLYQLGRVLLGVMSH